MWSRVVEAMLACWLAISPFLFSFRDDDTLLWVNALGGGAAVAILALASLDPRRDRLHLGILAIAGWLAAHTLFAGGPPPVSAAHQNQIAVALLLAMLAILPTRSDRPPAPWVDFYERRRGTDDRAREEP